MTQIQVMTMLMPEECTAFGSIGQYIHKIYLEKYLQS